MTLVELLVTVLITGTLATAVAAAATVFLRTSTVTSARFDESADALIAASYLGGDTQSAAYVSATACAAASGETRLLSLHNTDGSAVAYYASTSAGTVTRRTCSSNGTLKSAQILIRKLTSTLPTVKCDGATCVVGNAPRKIVMTITERSGFSFDLAGAARSDVDRHRRRHRRRPEHVGVRRPRQRCRHRQGLRRLDTERPGDVLVASASTNWLSLSGDATMPISGSVVYGGVDPLIAMEAAVHRRRLSIWTDGNYHGPGIYRGTKLSIGAPTTFAPGTYILEEGLAVSGSGSITGSEVFLFNGCAIGSPASCKNNGKLVVSSASVSLTPPSSGTYAGVLYYQHRLNDQDIAVSGGSDVTSLTGILYAPSSDITLGSGGSGLTLGSVVGKKVVISGGSQIVVG